MITFARVTEHVIAYYVTISERVSRHVTAVVMITSLHHLLGNAFWRHLYSFLVIRMNEPCWGPVTPTMSTGELKFLKYLSALQMR